VSYLRQSSTILNYLSDQDFTDITQQALSRRQQASNTNTNKNNSTTNTYSSTKISLSKSSSLRPSLDIIISKSSSIPSSDINHVDSQQENPHLSSKHNNNKFDLPHSQAQTQTQRQSQSSSQLILKNKSSDSNTKPAKEEKSDEKKYTCPQCNKKCMNKVSLWYHKKTCNPFSENEKISKDKEGEPEEEKYTCPQCSREFTNIIGLRNHKRACISVNENDTFNCESNGDEEGEVDVDGTDNLDTSFSDTGKEGKNKNHTSAKNRNASSSQSSSTSDDVISPEIIKTAFHHFLQDNYDKVKFEMGQATPDEKIMSNIRQKWNKLHSKDPTCVYELKTYLNLAKKTIIQ
jgi:DNA-directed RNA polymerase subunit RPC12/RpoP